MAYIVDDTRETIVGASIEEKKFPWGILVIGLITVGTMTMVVRKKG